MKINHLSISTVASISGGGGPPGQAQGEGDPQDRLRGRGTLRTGSGEGGPSGLALGSELVQGEGDWFQ